ncbi:MAG: XRE family transcriptional regulator [Planctomycetota bacterium]
MIDIGLEIKILRERMKISAKELAERIGLSQSQMSRLEKGQRRIDTNILAKISEALGVEPSHFFRGSDAPGEVIPPSDTGGLGKQIRSLRRKHHMSAEELASRIGTTKARVLSIEEGKRSLEPEFADKIAKSLKLPANHFLKSQQDTIDRLEAQIARLNQELAERHRAPEIPAPVPGGESARSVPILGSLALGYPETFDANGEPSAETDDFLYLPGITDPQCFAVYVVGDSMDADMAPRFREGDIAAFSKGATRSRDFAFVRLEGESPLFRQVFYDLGGRIRLQPLNLNYPARHCTRDEILGMWRLVGHVARY